MVRARNTKSGKAKTMKGFFSKYYFKWTFLWMRMKNEEWKVRISVASQHPFIFKNVSLSLFIVILRGRKIGNDWMMKNRTVWTVWAVHGLNSPARRWRHALSSSQQTQISTNMNEGYKNIVYTRKGRRGRSTVVRVQNASIIICRSIFYIQYSITFSA